jgi:hypothetical protein
VLPRVRNGPEVEYTAVPFGRYATGVATVPRIMTEVSATPATATVVAFIGSPIPMATYWLVLNDAEGTTRVVFKPVLFMKSDWFVVATAPVPAAGTLIGET